MHGGGSGLRLNNCFDVKLLVIGFSFKPVEEKYVHKIISNLNAKKATGADNISAKLLISCAASISRPISNPVNIAFSKSQFSVGIKVAQGLPLYKKKYPLNKENYRPVSILPTISKFFKRCMLDQLSNFMDNHFNPFLAAFRKGFGCQSTLLRLLEDWRKTLDSHECVAAILMDLSGV